MLIPRDSTRGISVPAWMFGIGAPAAALALLTLYVDLAFLPTVGRSGDARAQVTSMMTLYFIYAAGYAGFSVLRWRTSHDTALTLALCMFAAGAVVVLFSFGVRTAGAVAGGLSLGGFAVAIGPGDEPLKVRLRPPARSTMLYAICALVVPLVIGNVAAARNYSTSGNPVSETFAVVWMLFGLYAFGYAFWSYLRSVSEPAAIFSASVCAFWGFPLFVVLASLDPLSIVPFVSGVGGVVACLPYFWSQPGDDAAAARIAR